MEEEYYFRKEIRERFSQVLKKDGRSLRAIGKESGICDAVIGKYRDGAYLPNAYSMAKLCKTLNVSADWLLGLSDKGGPTDD